MPATQATTIGQRREMMQLMEAAPVYSPGASPTKSLFYSLAPTAKDSTKPMPRETKNPI